MRSIIAALLRVPADVRVLLFGLVALAVLLPAVSLPLALSTPIVGPQVAVASVAKDQSRHPVGLFEAEPVPFLEFELPEIDARLFAPMEPKAVAPIIYRKHDEEPKAKGKRSEIEGMQLAALSPVTSEPEFETRSVTLRTPFGTDIKTKVSLSGISPRLVAYLKKLQSECGQVTVISGVRSSGVPGTCHRGGHAVDIQIADHACAWRYARNWSGGHSNDYLGVQRLARGMPAHYHISDCPREMGARFAHRGGGVSRARYAKRSRTGRRVRVAHARHPARQQIDRPMWTSGS